MSREEQATTPVSPRALTATVTLFGSDGRVDQGLIREHLGFLRDAGASGVFALGTTGEFSLLTTVERLAIAETTFEVFSPLDVVVLASDLSTTASVSIASDLLYAGATQLAFLPPLYVQVDDAAVLRHFDHLSRRVPATELYMYNNPPRAGIDLTPELVTKVAAETNFRGIKDSGGGIERLEELRYLEPHVDVLVGTTRHFAWAATARAKGVVSSVANAFPELVAEVVEGDIDEVRRERLQEAVLYAQACVAGYCVSDGARLLMAARGLAVGGARVPFGPLAAADVDRVRRELRSVAELEDLLKN